MNANIPELSAGYDEKFEEIIDAIQKYTYENF